MRTRIPIGSIVLTCLTAILACGAPGSASQEAPRDSDSARHVTVQGVKRDTAIFAGGCFWCMEPPFDELAGVISTTSGYSGGTVPNPTYEQVGDGKTGHAEVVRVIFDPSRVSYERLLDVFWRNIDPLTANAQFCDRGNMYRSAIFYRGEKQREAALASKLAIERSGRFREPIVTQIVAASQFYEAEAYHQDYYKKNPIRYKFYRSRCGRDARLEALWGKA
jgi:peptide-methionine (S)-S-oxide reductase